MLLLVQRVKQAHVEIQDEITGAIDTGLVVFVCAEPNDTTETLEKALLKILQLRIFPDDNKKMNLNVQQVHGGLLLVSQFTLAAETHRGNRPSFTKSAPPEVAKKLYDQFITKAKKTYHNVATGEFAADMNVHLINDGPITIPLHIH